MREWLPELAWNRPVTVLMAFLALLVIGLIAWWRIPVQMMPSGFENPGLFVIVPYPSATPLETDEAVVRPLLTQLSTVSGIQSVRSDANANQALFRLRFYSSTDMDEAYNEVVDRIERAMIDLPPEIDRYWVHKFNPEDQPIAFIGVSLPDDVADPYHVLTRVVEPRLERVPGVASIDVYGVPQRNVYIDYDRESVVAHSVNLGDLQRRLATDNFQMSGGTVEHQGRVHHVRSLSLLDDIEVLRRYPVQGDVVLGDIADVQMRPAYSTSVNRLNGEDAAIILVRKESSANTIETSDAVKAAIAELQGSSRVEGVGFFVLFSQGDLVSASVDNLLYTAFLGGIFAVVILYAFLREWRMTLLITASIPFSLLITIAILYFRGESLNLLALMGLMLAVGMVVDNAIVVVETIYRRRAEGASPKSAAVLGTAEVNLAILLSTLTTMVVFLPLILMSESAAFSFFMGVLGFPVVFALAASLLVALVFAPLATRFVGAAHVRPDPRWLRWVTERYAVLLAAVLRRRTDATVVVIGFTVATFAIPCQGLQGGGDDDGGALNNFSIQVEVPPQADVAQRHAIMRSIEEALEAQREAWGINVYYAELESGGNHGEVEVFLRPDAPISREEAMDRAEELLPKDQPGVTTEIARGGGMGGDEGNAITLRIEGEDMGTLVALGDEVARRVKSVDGVVAARRDVINTGTDELQLQLNRRALERYGLDGQTVGRTVAYYLRSNELPSILDEEREIHVISRFELEDRDDLDTVMDFPIFSATIGRLLPLRAMTDVRAAKGPHSIRRTDNRTAIEVTVDLDEDVDVEDGFDRIAPVLSDMQFPRGYGWSHGMQLDIALEDDAARNLAMLLSVIFVFLIMGVLFESVVLPMAILTTIPMSLFGVFWTLWITGTPFSLMAGIGLVILVGVVVNNGIVLIDLVKQLRADGMERREALIEAGRRRFRPIVMTALTTICGLIPMAIGSTNLVGIPYAPLGRTVIGGLAASTVLTLLFVPFFYEVLDDLGRTTRGLVRLWVGGR